MTNVITDYEKDLAGFSRTVKGISGLAEDRSWIITHVRQETKNVVTVIIDLSHWKGPHFSTFLDVENIQDAYREADKILIPLVTQYSLEVINPRT